MYVREELCVRCVCVCVTCMNVHLCVFALVLVTEVSKHGA